MNWIKTNPQPLNSSRNYLTNCREIALVGIKNQNQHLVSMIMLFINFLSKVVKRVHPTQKSLPLFETLEKHSNENDIVLDTFLGSGTTAKAAKNTKRNF